jgi:hypothetical protein
VRIVQESTSYSADFRPHLSSKIDPQGLRQRRCKDLVVKGRDGEFEAYFGH